jgi:anti-sigma factor RsiW
MDCSDIRRKLAAYSDGGLDSAAKELASRHLDTCPGCREELAQLARLNAELNRFERVDVRPYFITRLKQRIADRAHSRRSHWLRRVLVPAGALAVGICAAFAGIGIGRGVYVREASRMSASTSTRTGIDMLDGTGTGSLAGVGDVLFSGGDGE